MGHPYLADVIYKKFGNGATETPEGHQYRELLEILMCRERQLEIAVSLLSEKNRKKVGA